MAETAEKPETKEKEKTFLYCEVMEDHGDEVTLMLGKVLSINLGNDGVQNESGRTVVRVPKKDIYFWRAPDRPVFEE